MNEIKFKCEEKAKDDHEIYVKLKIEGKKQDVKKVLEMYIR